MFELGRMKAASFEFVNQRTKFIVALVVVSHHQLLAKKK